MQWLPQEDDWLAVSTLSSILMYHLAQAAHEPLLTLNLPEGASLASCSFARTLSPVEHQVHFARAFLPDLLLGGEGAAHSGLVLGKHV